MTTTPPAAAAIAQLEAEGVDAVISTVVNAAGLIQAKIVPIRRINTFAAPGLGASPVWHAFAIDQSSIAFTANIGAVGDRRIRLAAGTCSTAPSCDRITSAPALRPIASRPAR